MNYLLGPDSLVIHKECGIAFPREFHRASEKKSKRFTVQLLEEATEIAVEPSLETEISERI